MKALLWSACLVALATICFAQAGKNDKPDLSGTWKLDAGKNKEMLEEIKITHHDPQFIVRRTVPSSEKPEGRELTYFTDGRGETNLVELGTPEFESWRPSEIDSTTTWEKNNVVTRSVSRAISSSALYEVEIVDEWQLSADGKTLTLTTKHSPKKDSPGNAAPGGPTEFKRVYKLISR